jgi:hypothetical protein
MRPAQPAISLSTRVSVETDERRRRLQARTGYSVPRLVDEALRNLEDRLQTEYRTAEPAA